MCVSYAVVEGLIVEVLFNHANHVISLGYGRGTGKCGHEYEKCSLQLSEVRTQTNV